MSKFAPDIEACRGRQQRLIHEMQRLDVSLAVVTQRAHVLWLTGLYFGPFYQPAAALSIDGQLTLVVPDGNVPEQAAADEVLPYEAARHSTLRNDQRAASSAVLVAAISKQAKAGRLGVEYSSFCPHLSESIGSQQVDVEPTLHVLRRRKDPDELRMMKRAIAATCSMYQHARTAIEPGINELDLYSQLQTVAVRELGEPLTYFGQDFQCNSPGGPPRDRCAKKGELYILDLGVGFRGYYSDNSRTIAVDGQPTDDQHRAWNQILKIFEHVESTVKPGVSCQKLFHEAQALLDECLPWQFYHHLGHGVGLFPHEAPHLNPNWDDTFEEGDVFTVEPGLYHDELKHGMRLEQNYRVTADGVELLTNFSLSL